MHATRSPELLRIREAAERLNVSRASIYRWIDEGRVPAVQLGGRGAPLRIPEDELDAWLYADVGGSLSSRPPADSAKRRAPVDPAVEARALAGGDESR
jgi:excisionase family DNA binding protein